MDFFADGFREAWRLVVEGDRDVLHALGVSILTSTIAIVLAAVVAIPYGAWLGGVRPRGYRLQRFVLRTLLFVPTVVIGLLVYGMLSYRGPLGALDLLYSRGAIAAGLTLLAFPVLAAHAEGATEGLDRLVVDEARTLGAGTFRTVRLVLAEVRPTLVTALLTGFGRCVTELGIATIAGGSIRMETRTLTGSIQLELVRGEFGRAVACGLLLLAVALPISVAAGVRGRDRAP